MGEETPTTRGGPTRPGDGTFGGRGGFGGILSGSVDAADGEGFTVTTQSGEAQVTLDENSIIQIYETGTTDDLSPGSRVSVIVSGDVQSGGPVTAASVVVNPPDRGGIIGGPGGIFGVILIGTISAVDGNILTVTTDSGETQVTLDDDSTIQTFLEGIADDISSGDRVLVISSGDVPSGEPVIATSVIVNPPEGGGVFGGRPRIP